MSKTKILIVEDESIVALDIQTRLNKLGYIISAIACSGEEAINQTAKHKPDLVIMDINLKGRLDGVEAAREIYTRFDIPVIYLTANADKNTIEQAKTTEPFGYLLKPFKEKELHTTIEITLSRHRTERKLKESEQWLTTVLKSIGDAVIASNAFGAVTFMNPVAEALTGWKQEDALGKDATEVFKIAREETPTQIESPITQALQNGVTVNLPEQTILIARNGAEIPIHDSVAPIKDDKGNITGTVLVFRDITERKRAEEAHQKHIEQERLVAQLEKLNHLKDDFLSTVSHELRTPITNMKMAIQMLKVSGGSNERNRRYLEILQAECARETELVNSLLDLQRLEAASYPIFLFEALSLQDWLPSIIEPFRVRTQERQQNLQINLPPDMPPLVSDHASLERILVELLNNACKYTPAGGEIVLSVERNVLSTECQLEEFPTSTAECQFSQPGSHWHAEVPPLSQSGVEPKHTNASSLNEGGLGSPLGIRGKGGDPRTLLSAPDLQHETGSPAPPSSTIFTISNSVEIPAAELPRIFDKFYRIPKADRWQQGGTGLGLALVEKLVEQLQGNIQVESGEGWTTFTIQLFSGEGLVPSP